MLLAERPARLRGVGAVVLLAVAIGVALSTAPAAGAASKRVTFAARVCDSYTQIFANEARNNLMESLQQLGPSTPYSSTSQMDPLVEARPPQDACRPLVGWRFTLGTGIAGTKLDGVWGSLSQVSNAYDTVISTTDETPILGPSGAPSGGSLKGAVTIDLTRDQEDKAGSSNLWVMGGTSAAPVGDPTTYAFGALRCAVDNLNGDNVEFVSYPAQVEHVYCFAYYVSPPKGSGKIIVKKHITGLPAGTPAQTVNFLGNISFANSDPVGHPDDGTFALTSSATVDGSATFVREAGTTWNFREVATSSLTAQSVTCTAAGGPNGRSTITNPDPNPARPNGVTVGLVDGDVVTCVFTNAFVPPTVGLVVRKVTRGGVGSFGFTVSGFDPFTLTTTQAGTPAQRTLNAAPGSTHTITETLPDSDRGTWAAESATCSGAPVRPALTRSTSRASITVTVPAAGAGLVCTFTNRFTPNGVIRIHKVTRGGTATATFYVEPQFGTPRRFVQRATTTAPDTPATARPVNPIDATTALPLGEYSIQELAPFVDNGTWNLVAVLCDRARPAPAAAGAIVVELTADDPEVDCTFTDELATEPPEPEPVPPPVPVPPVVTVLPPPSIQVGGVATRSRPVPQADLVVTKVAVPRTVVLGSDVSYLVTVRNRGPATARGVTIVEPIARGRAPLRLVPSRGRCRGAVPRFCVLGSLGPGQSATVRVTSRPRRTGRFTNVVAAVTATQVRSRATMFAAARIRVVRGTARFTG